MAKYYPIFLNIVGKKCVVIGGGSVAWRKVCSLMEAGAMVTVVSPEFCSELEKETGIEKIRQKYSEELLGGAVIVVASTDDQEVNKKVYYDAVNRGIPVNVVDKPEYCSFIVPSSFTRGDLCISISTGGASPALASNIRAYLEKQFGDEYEKFVKLLSEMRRKVISEIEDESIRRAILQRIAGLDFLEIIRKDGISEAKRKMLALISEKILNG